MLIMIETWNKYIASSDQSTLDLLRPEHEAEMDIKKDIKLNRITYLFEKVCLTHVYLFYTQSEGNGILNTRVLVLSVCGKIYM